jgi:sigma-E factor negative regulatory protein RseB
VKPLSYWVPPLLLAVLLVPVAYAEAAENSTEIWLHRMNVAMRTLNYEGTFVYIHDNHLETMQVAHRADAKGGIERLISLTGPPREVIRDHKEVKCVLPENHSVLIERRYAAAHFPAPIPRTIPTNKLLTHYIFKDLGDDRIAGHACKIVSIQPRDHYRYGYRLWLDKNTAMLLRSDLITQTGLTVERIMFTSISYPVSIPNAALEATEIRPGYTWNIQGGGENPTSFEARLNWKAKQLPPGFLLSMNSVQRLAGAPYPVRHLVYTDGLAYVSVFIENSIPGHKELIGPSRMEAVSAFGRLADDYSITAIGEVPPKTVELIAQSMVPDSRP